MYSNKLVACVKAGGKVLREKGEEVLLPFGAEYSLYFKNEHSRKVQIEVEIDGESVMGDKALLLDAGETMDLKGFIKDTYGHDNRAFKFITKTNEISDFRGDRAEDGLIKVSYTFEKERPVLRTSDFFQHDIYRTYTNCGPDYPKSGGFVDNIDLSSTFGINSTQLGGDYDYSKDLNSTNISHSVNDTMETSYMANSVTNSVSASYSDTTSLRSVDLGSIMGQATATAAVSDEPGITVEGSNTGQSFQRGSIGTLEDKSFTMVFQLKGLTCEEVVTEPVTVKTKKQCPSCGKKYKSSFEYCPQDGTFLR